MSILASVSFTLLGISRFSRTRTQKKRRVSLFSHLFFYLFFAVVFRLNWTEKKRKSWEWTNKTQISNNKKSKYCIGIGRACKNTQTNKTKHSQLTWKLCACSYKKKTTKKRLEEQQKTKKAKIFSLCWCCSVE